MNLLRFNEIVHPIMCYDDFLSDDEIDQIFKHTKKLKYFDGKIEDNDDSLFDKKIRQSSIKWISLDENINWLFKKIILKIYETNQLNFHYILKFFEDLQFTEYKASQEEFYAKHRDGSILKLSDFVETRKLSFTIQLTDENEYDGGDLIFYLNDDDKIIKTNASRKKGAIIFFESTVLHEVTPVTKGTRHSLVSWVWGPNLR